jgi:hypothetical protein
MNEELQAILDEYGIKIVDLIKQILVDEDKVVTGATRDSVFHEVEPFVLTVYGAAHLAVIDSENGRGPTENSGGEGFFEQIETWANIRGIPEEFHRIIYLNINREGWKSDGLNHLIEQGVDDMIDEMLIEMNDKIDRTIKSTIESMFKE